MQKCLTLIVLGSLGVRQSTSIGKVKLLPGVKDESLSSIMVNHCLFIIENLK